MGSLPLAPTGKFLFKGQLYTKMSNKGCYSVSISKFNTKRDVKNEEKTKSQSSLAKAEAKGRQDVSELDAKESTGDLELDAGLNPGEHGF